MPDAVNSTPSPLEIPPALHDALEARAVDADVIAQLANVALRHGEHPEDWEFSLSAVQRLAEHLQDKLNDMANPPKGAA